MDPTKTNWTRPKQLVLDQNDLDIQNHFGPIEGQGISLQNRSCTSNDQQIIPKVQNNGYIAIKNNDYLQLPDLIINIRFELPGHPIVLKVL